MFDAPVPGDTKGRKYNLCSYVVVGAFHFFVIFLMNSITIPLATTTKNTLTHLGTPMDRWHP